MSKTWILDVIADLRTFARDNDMPTLASHLKDSEVVAMAEFASREHADAACKGWKDDAENRAVLTEPGGGPRHN